MESITAALYLRKSRAEELAQPTEDTVAKHKSKLLEFAAKHQITVTDIYEEVVSGEFLYTRPKMLELLSKVSEGAYQAVLCMEISRLGRGGMADQGIILDTFKASGTKIITPAKTYDLSDDWDEEYTEFETFLSRRELKTIKRRLRTGLEQTIKNGAYVSNPPYGYDKATINKLPSLTINPAEAEFVRMIFDLYVNQRMGCQSIGRYIASLGAKPKRGGSFGPSAIRKILQNQTYLGKVVWNRVHYNRYSDHGIIRQTVRPNEAQNWIVADGLHAPIIDEKTFQAAQEIMARHSNPPVPKYKGYAETNPLAGLLICRKCGHKMQARYFQKAGRQYVLCTTPGCCKSTPLSLVENAILQYFRTALGTLPISMPAGQKAPNLQPLIQTAQRDLAAVRAQKGRLYDLVEKGIYDPETFAMRLQILEEKSKQLTDALSALRQQEHAQADTRSALPGQTIHTVLEAYQAASPREKNMLLKAVIDHMVYYKEKTAKTEEFELELYTRL